MQAQQAMGYFVKVILIIYKEQYYGYAYSNNGLPMQSIGSESDITTGEVYFGHEAMEPELSAAFSSYTAAAV